MPAPGRLPEHEAANGAKGLRQASDLVPDLILLDLMLTARDQARDQEAGRQAGADACLTKPFRPRTR